MTENEALDKLNNLHYKIVHTSFCNKVYESEIEALCMAKDALEEIQRYRAIGTIEECRAAVEKMKPKKAIREKGIPYCPCCGAVATTDTGDSFLDYEVTHCDNCGQAIGEGEWLKELKQYREIGTLEELQKAKEQYDDINSVAEQTALMGLSDFARAKEAVKTEIKRSLDYSLKEYQKIGTVGELKALKEKSVANETVENDAYLWSCKCPNCGKKIHRGSEERTFYCEQCGIQLYQRAFTEKELDEARFERQMDEYED